MTVLVLVGQVIGQLAVKQVWARQCRIVAVPRAVGDAGCGQQAGPEPAVQGLGVLLSGRPVPLAEAETAAMRVIVKLLAVGVLAVAPASAEAGAMPAAEAQPVAEHSAVAKAAAELDFETQPAEGSMGRVAEDGWTEKKHSARQKLQQKLQELALRWLVPGPGEQALPRE